MYKLLQLPFRVWQAVSQLLDLLQSPTLLLARGYVAYAFFASGLTKIHDWGTTVALFTDEYKVPLLSPTAAAAMGTAGELVLPVLLLLGLGSRFAALGLSVVNIIAVIALQEICCGVPCWPPLRCLAQASLAWSAGWCRAGLF
jgi:putative oxidoreductase